MCGLRRHGFRAGAVRYEGRRVLYHGFYRRAARYGILKPGRDKQTHWHISFEEVSGWPISLLS